MKHKTLLVCGILILAALILFESCETGRIPRVTRPQGEYLHPQTKTVYPEVIGGLQRMWITNFETEQPGLGVGIAYGEHKNEAGRIKVDIYIYDNRLTNIPDGIGTPLISQHFEQVVGDIYDAESRGVYRSVEKLSEAEVNLGSYRALSARFSYFFDDIERVSYVILTGYKNHFFKIRCTYHKSVEFYGEETFNRFLDDTGKILTKGNE